MRGVRLLGRRGGGVGAWSFGLSSRTLRRLVLSVHEAGPCCADQRLALRTDGRPTNGLHRRLPCHMHWIRASLFGFTLPHGAVRPAAFADSINNFDSSHTACVRYGCRGSGHSKFFNTVRVSVKEGCVAARICEQNRIKTARVRSRT